MTSKVTRWVVLATGLLFLLAGWSPLLFGQSIYGTIEGTVTDPSGAVVAGAKVEVSNQSTGSTRSTVTDDSGDYNVVNLDPGTYTLSASAPGFVTATRRDFPLLAREIARADLPLTLATGGVQTVEVTAKSTVVDQAPTVSDSKSGPRHQFTGPKFQGD